MLPLLAPEMFNTFNTFGIFNAHSDDLCLLELLVPQSLARYSPAVRG
jgi:hypothetical protein